MERESTILYITIGGDYEIQAAMYAALMSKLKPKGSNFTPPKKKRKKKK